ncbi:MAG: hypothetical protein PHS57_08870 [Alphaproteobacteria bacterium]|nr:hypothetical protein [Alphaproteobacteria bacterium]
MKTGRIENTENGIRAILETDSLIDLAESMRAHELRGKLSALIAAVDLERGKWERADDVNQALQEACDLLAAIRDSGVDNEND